jgi:hypothetical protein
MYKVIFDFGGTTLQKVNTHRLVLECCLAPPSGPEIWHPVYLNTQRKQHLRCSQPTYWTGSPQKNFQGEWVLCLMDRPSETATNQKLSTAAFPYVQNLSNHIVRILVQYNIRHPSHYHDSLCWAVLELVGYLCEIWSFHCNWMQWSLLRQSATWEWSCDHNSHGWSCEKTSLNGIPIFM